MRTCYPIEVIQTDLWQVRKCRTATWHDSQVILSHPANYVGQGQPANSSRPHFSMILCSSFSKSYDTRYLLANKLPSNIFGRLKICLFHSIFIQFFVRAISNDKSESVQIRGCLQIGDIENRVCTRVTNCFSADERVILVFMSRVAKQPGK